MLISLKSPRTKWISWRAWKLSLFLTSWLTFENVSFTIESMGVDLLARTFLPSAR